MLPHHDGSERYVSDLSPSLGDVVTLSVLVPASFDCRKVWLRTTPDGEPHFDEASPDRPSAQGTWWRVGVRLHNPVTNYRFALEGGPFGYRWLNGAGVFLHDVPDTDDFRLTTFEPPPSWLADRVCYQIFPDRFASSGVERDWPDWAAPSAWDEPIDRQHSSRQVYGGDIAGIERRLDHIDRLGANLLYLTPFFPAESNHRYNATTFDRVDPLLGGDDALVSLVAAAHRRDIRIIGDITANHSGSSHDWFRAAQADPASAEAGFYTFREHPADYESWQNVPSLPKFDLRSDELRQRLVEGESSVVGRYIAPRFGLDGWRVDVANMTGRLGAIDLNTNVATTMRETVKGVRSDAYLVAEHLYDAHADLLGDGWHGTMTYSGFTEPVWRWLAGPDAERIRYVKPLSVRRMPGTLSAATMRAFNALVPWRTLMANMNLLGSHDTARFRSIAGSTDRVLAGVGLLMAWPGIPMIFAGDEIGMAGDDATTARTPMQWDESRWDQRTLDTYCRLSRVRRSSHALQHGGLRWLHAGDDVLVVLRESSQERVMVQISRAAHDPVELNALELALESAEPLFGNGEPFTRRPTIVLTADGPTVRYWRLDP